MTLNITFLGTGTSQGVPVIACECRVCQSDDPKDKRLRSSIYIEAENTKLVIDIGPDFRQQMLLHNINDLDAVLLTHEHQDHIAGLDDIRPFNFRHNKDMPLFGSEHTLSSIKSRFDYIFSTSYPGLPKVELQSIEAYQKFKIKNLEILPLLGNHGKMPVMGFKIKQFAYFTDVKNFPDPTIVALQNLDTLVIDALHHHQHHAHMTIQESLDMIAYLKPRQAYIIHMSHLAGSYQDLLAIMPPNVLPAYDGLKIRVE